MLAVRNLAVDIDGSPVLRGVSFEVKAGELVCLVGRNGAGKTTSFRTVMGFRRPVAGAIAFDGRDICGLRPFEIARLGVGFAPEESEVFGELTVAENIACRPGPPRPAQPASADRRRLPGFSPARALSRARRPGALRRRAQDGVDRPRARARPEAAAARRADRGAFPVVVPSIIEGLAKIRAFGHAVFIAELNIHHVPDFADRLYVIERGEIIFAGRPDAARAGRRRGAGDRRAAGRRGRPATIEPPIERAGAVIDV